MGRRNPIEHRLAVGLLLRQIRLEAALSQEAVAEKLARPQSFVSKVEAGEQRLDVLELREVLAALGATLNSFTGRLERELKSIGPGTLPLHLPRSGRSRRTR